MSEELNVLILEDRASDAALLVRALEQDGIALRWTRVQTERDYLAELGATPDIILADYSLPQFNVLRALVHLRARNLDIPLVVVTGTVSEEAAVECIREGAADYLLKGHLTRLGSAVRHALTAKHLRTEHRAAERLAQSTLDSLPDHVAILDDTGTIVTVNQAWRGFARRNGFADVHDCVGAAYLTVCDTAEGAWTELAHGTAAGIRAVISRSSANWLGEYPCHTPAEERWYEVRVSRFAEPGPPYLIVSHHSVTERKLAEQRYAQLLTREQAARAHAEQFAALQSDFVSAASHELRSPLTAVLGFGELLQAKWGSMSETKRLARVGQIVQAAERQKRLVDDLLLASRLENVHLLQQPVMLSLAALLRQAAAEVKGSYPGQDIVLDGPDELQVFADAAHTVQVLTNLLDNAAKYSPEGSPITVRWGYEEELAVLRVRDLGTGVPEQGRDRLFMRFGRLPGSAIRAGHVGTGLGLFISRGLAQAMCGSLDLEATGPQGSTFRLCLPAHAPAPAA